MNLYILQQYKFIKQLFKNEQLIDMLIAMEDFLDIIGIYSYENWEKGQIVGSEIKKYYTILTLKFPYNDMPNPKVKKILEKYKCLVAFREADDYQPIDNPKETDDTYIDTNTGQRKNKIKKEKIWLVDIMIPRRYIENDTLYDLDAIQEFLDEEKEEDNE